MSGQYNAAFPLHESQETILENEQEFRIKLGVRITYDFIMELLSQTQDMTVVAPQLLKDELVEIYKQALKRTINQKYRNTMDSGILIILVVAGICILLIPILYSDNNKRKAKANADAMKEMLKELEKETEIKD